jgi:two-component system phosphate regulon response regulator PhoB
MTRVLVVDDEADLRETLAFQLEDAGFTVAQAATGGEALEVLERDGPFDLMVLDLMLPDVSGLEVCRSLRAKPDTKDLCVLMLTARGEEIDRVIGFEMGADDYVVKPFSTRELVLRLKALARRGSPPPAAVAERLVFGVLMVDLAGHRVSVGGDEIALTALEFKLLTTLMRRKGRVQSRERLLVDVWEMSPDVATRTVDTHIKRLREKLHAAGDYIETVRGAGYRFRDKAP